MDDTLLYSLRALQQSVLLQHKLLLQAADTLLPSSSQQLATGTTAFIDEFAHAAAAIVSNERRASEVPSPSLAPQSEVPSLSLSPKSGIRISYLKATVAQLQQQIDEVGEELHHVRASNARIGQTLSALNDMRKISNGS